MSEPKCPRGCFTLKDVEQNMVIALEWMLSNVYGADASLLEHFSQEVMALLHMQHDTETSDNA